MFSNALLIFSITHLNNPTYQQKPDSLIHTAHWLN